LLGLQIAQGRGKVGSAAAQLHPLGKVRGKVGSAGGWQREGQGDQTHLTKTGNRPQQDSAHGDRSASAPSF
jgi:hypothetical protein